MRPPDFLVLLPGMLCDAAFWRAQIDALGDVADAIVPSFGVLDSFDAMADAVLAGAPDRFALAGHSMGGRVALEILRRAPERVLKLGLFATDYRGHADEQARAAEEARRTAILARIDAEGMEGFARFWAPQVIAPGNMGDPALVGEAVAMMARHDRAACAAQTLAGLTRRDQADVLAAVACPTLVLAGREDKLRPVAVHADMAARVSGSRLSVIEHAAHMIAMEQPAAVAAEMRRWLTGA
ncbi:MAG TPA: alpha/beta hydrolase [Rhizomicrobium sp.]|jgi:pimeloyl-ACP methyl ester carboxylesterase|nr:alpha/beta hydrolase [Rhizomicrobium sp.]